MTVGMQLFQVESESRQFECARFQKRRRRFVKKGLNFGSKSAICGGFIGSLERKVHPVSTVNRWRAVRRTQQ